LRRARVRFGTSARRDGRQEERRGPEHCRSDSVARWFRTSAVQRRSCGFRGERPCGRVLHGVASALRGFVGTPSGGQSVKRIGLGGLHVGSGGCPCHEAHKKFDAVHPGRARVLRRHGSVWRGAGGRSGRGEGLTSTIEANWGTDMQTDLEDGLPSSSGKDALDATMTETARRSRATANTSSWLIKATPTGNVLVFGQKGEE